VDDFHTNPDGAVHDENSVRMDARSLDPLWDNWHNTHVHDLLNVGVPIVVGRTRTVGRSGHEIPSDLFQEYTPAHVDNDGYHDHGG